MIATLYKIAIVAGQPQKPRIDASPFVVSSQYLQPYQQFVVDDFTLTSVAGPLLSCGMFPDAV